MSLLRRKRQPLSDARFLEILLEDDQVLTVPINEVVVHLLQRFGVRGLYRAQRHAIAVVHINRVFVISKYSNCGYFPMQEI